ncbi:hypothetical protein JJB11_13970 [Ramlibacter ginsenosidimutans]|uniref:Uncharacterized protein n=1 Tax=Ramlibacter ginsenosidimutans TaxID=502333 RepID=A0A934WN59_9BURK|nr:hypothetical protein [Ramlibacter ginsenosidimutans]MBK6007203.1 hypothetical protein [Ramlibacter ginsenosidimutans]
MKDLARHQRALLALLRRGTPPDPEDDPYLHRVAASPDLAEARGNILFWRIYVLERTCVLTVALLRGRRTLTATLHDFIAGHNLSPFREFQPRAFLAWLSVSGDPVLAAVASFEMALTAVREGDTTAYEVHWPVDPHLVLDALTRGSPLTEPLPQTAWVARVCHAIPGGFSLDPSGNAGT